MGLYSEEDIKKSKERADKFTQEIKEKQKKDTHDQDIIGWMRFLISAGLTGLGIWIVILIMRALLKYIG